MFNQEVVEYLDPDTDDATELWTLGDTEHLLKVYHDALPVLYGEDGNNIDVWQTLLANLEPNVAEKYDANKVRDRINYIFSYQAKQLPVNKPLLPLLKIIEKLEKKLTQANLTNNTSQTDNYDDLNDEDVIENEASQDEAEITYENDNEYREDAIETEDNDEFKEDDDDDAYIENQLEEEKEDLFDPNDSIRWTGKEILRIMPIYKKYIKELVASNANKEKKLVWEKIADEMVMVGGRKCNHYLARMKIMNLKKTWQKHSESNVESKWRYFKEMSQIMKEEEKAKAIYLGNGKPVSSSDDGSEEEEEVVTTNKRKRKSDEPSWFLQYRNDAEKRHEEKMKLKCKLLTVLEQFAERFNK